MDGADGDPVVIPFNHEDSELYDRITRPESSNGDMPPSSSASLSSEEIELIAQWIDEGALEEPEPVLGCTDVEAYNCANDNVWSNYIFDVGGIMYDNSCNWDWDTINNEAVYVGGCELGVETCGEGFYNPEATIDDGSCSYDDADQDGICDDADDCFGDNEDRKRVL